MVNALIKVNWSVDPNSYYIRADRLSVFIDILAYHQEQDRLIFIEVKCFADINTDQDEFYRAIGQYLVYRKALDEEGSTEPLYLGVPVMAYQRFFTIPIVQSVVREFRIKMVVVDIEREEIVEWID